MESTFFNAKFSHIVAFDHFKFEFNPENIKALKSSTIYNKIPSVKCKKLNDKIYSKKFVEKYPELLNVSLKINVQDYITQINEKGESLFLEECADVFELCEDSLSPNVLITICFDLIGVSSARFDFEITKPLKTTALINYANITACFVDTALFSEIKNLMILIPKVVNKEIKNDVHDTYSVIYSTDSDIDLAACRDEISGIVSLNDAYIHFSKDMVKKKMKNAFSHYENTLIITGYSATFMMFKDLKRLTKKPKRYINELITAVEMYHRQRYLLKTLDIYLDKLIRDLKENKGKFDNNSLKSKMNEIKKTQIDIQSKLEIYRNTRLSIKASYIMFFDVLNEIFHLDKHYKFVLEKLDVNKSIYESLNEERRNTWMENIQVIIIILGIATVFATFSPLIFGADVNVGEWVIIMLFLLVLGLLLTLYIYRKRINQFIR